eukprot:5366089-Prymnesium_polylepis.1
MLQLVLLFAFKEYGLAPAEASPVAPQVYNYYIGVALMMLVGFGYLMTFLRWYGLGSVGLTMLITGVGVEVALLFEPFLEGTDATIGIVALLRSNFAVAAFL